jgi:putative transposase
VRALPDKFRKETRVEDGLRIEIYQGQFINKEFDFPLNVVIIVKTKLTTAAQAHVILFSTDMEQAYDQIINFYSLRFQIEFNFP